MEEFSECSIQVEEAEVGWTHVIVSARRHDGTWVHASKIIRAGEQVVLNELLKENTNHELAR